MKNRKYTVMRNYRDEYGNLRQRRVNMGSYILSTAKRIADQCRGGYVLPMGSNDPVYVGSFQ